MSKLSKIRKADPEFEREIAQYEFPLPSREYILQVLAEQEGVPLSFERLTELLDVHESENEFFARRLGAMARDGQLLQNRRDDWLVPDKADLVVGKIQGHKDGFGFLIPDNGSEHIFLAPKEMERALHGDRVIVRVVGVDRKGRPEGKIVEVTERVNKCLVGRVFQEHGVWFVVAENRRISQDILLAPPAKGDRKAIKPEAGQVVMVELIEQPSRHSQPIGRLVEVVGTYADPGMEIEIALRKHELPYEFSMEALAQTKKLPDTVRKADWKGREDITKLPLVTIDGETARDFDDAVYCAREGKGFRLIVAIADVSSYVDADSALDGDAYERGNSVYFPRRVIPMLPEKLSNGLCSLNPQVERLCMVCDMSVAANGVIKRYRFYPAVMFSHARLTYTEVAAALYDKEPITREKLAELLPHLEALDAVYRVFASSRSKRGAIDFDTMETRMVFDDNGKIERIEPYARNEAHKLIEECMLAANVCASEFLHDNEHPIIYRVHQGPTPERLAKLRDFLGTFGMQVGGGDTPSAKDYGQLIDKIQDRPDKVLLQTVMLRSLRQAVYTPDNVGHFGLAYDSYTHFTSPIRRYPDLLVHRAIKAVLAKTEYKPGSWEEIGMHCSQTERRADEATRDVENWLKCYFMQDKVGEEFIGSISSVVPFGIFVALDDVFVEGLVHVSDLGQDYFHFDEAAHAMVGERTNARYRLSDRVKVQVVRVDMDANKIDFRLVTEGKDQGKMQGKSEAKTVGKGSLKTAEKGSKTTAKASPWAEQPSAARPNAVVSPASDIGRRPDKPAATGKTSKPVAKKASVKPAAHPFDPKKFAESLRVLEADKAAAKKAEAAKLAAKAKAETAKRATAEKPGKAVSTAKTTASALAAVAEKALAEAAAQAAADAADFKSAVRKPKTKPVAALLSKRPVTEEVSGLTAKPVAKAAAQKKTVPKVADKVPAKATRKPTRKA